MTRKRKNPHAAPVKSAKDAFASVFETLGGTTRLHEWAAENPTEFFKLYARLIPHEVVGDPERPVGVVLLPRLASTRTPVVAMSPARSPVT